MPRQGPRRETSQVRLSPAGIEAIKADVEATTTEDLKTNTSDVHRAALRHFSTLSDATRHKLIIDVAKRERGPKP